MQNTFNSFLAFLEDRYLKEYIKEGGSKIKFVTGKKGSGKSFFLSSLQTLAKKNNYKVVNFSAKKVWLYDFKDIYLEILKQTDLENILSSCADRIITNLNEDPSLIPNNLKFLDYLSSKGALNPLMRRAIYDELKTMFLDNPLLDNNFAIACSLLTGNILGFPSLEDANKELLLGWLNGDPLVRPTSLRALGLSCNKISKLNARHMLRSLVRIICLAGYSGLLVCIDDLDILQNKSGLEEIHYTKMRRDDTFESIRQLIDDIDSLSNTMFVFGFEQELLHDERSGLKSYQALWMRIQNEINTTRFNKFADIINLDDFVLQEYSANDLVNLSKEIAINESNKESRTSISYEEANTLLEKARFSNNGIIELILETLKGEN